jgi:hypothetical protein
MVALKLITQLGGMELVSRIMETSSERWAEDCDLVFRTLNDYMETKLTRGCATHIHVSTTRTKKDRFKLEQLKSLLKMIVRFDDAITKVVPEERKSNVYALSNVHGKVSPFIF